MGAEESPPPSETCIAKILPLFLGAGHYQTLHKGTLSEDVKDDQRNAANQYGDGYKLQGTSVGNNHRL